MKNLIIFLLIVCFNAICCTSFIFGSFPSYCRENLVVSQYVKPLFRRNLLLKLSAPPNVAGESSQAKIHIVADGLPLTPALSERIHRKIGGVLQKVGKDVIKTQVALRVMHYPDHQNHSTTVKKNIHIAEATIFFKGGAAIHEKENSDWMYTSIDVLAHRLLELIKKHNEKPFSKMRKQLKHSSDKELSNDMKERSSAAIDWEENKCRSYNKDETHSSASNPKYPSSFEPPKLSLNEALRSAKTSIPSFFVFHNKDTNVTNAMYLRRDGTYELITPRR